MAIRHVVIWTLHDPADAVGFKAELDSCAGLVPGMREFEVGIRDATLEANADVVLVSLFNDEAALAAYQNHPHHQGVSARLGVLRSERRVVDYRCDGD
jgi:quinol monooxygenase YgiN